MPETIDTFAEKAAALLNDRHHGVLLTGVTLMHEICAIDSSIIEQYRRHVPMLCKILRSLLMSGFAPEHDVGGITDPFLQVKVLLAHVCLCIHVCSMCMLVFVRREHACAPARVLGLATHACHCGNLYQCLTFLQPEDSAVPLLLCTVTSNTVGIVLPSTLLCSP